jgi:hypothetical protein
VVTTDSDLNEIESKYSFLEFQMNISLQSWKQQPVKLGNEL